MNPRDKPHRSRPWCWQEKAALAKIAAVCDSRTDKAQVLAVYLAMTLHASNIQAETFKLEKLKLAGMAGVSYRKVADILKLLVEIGVLTSKANMVEGTKAQGPNTYTLCTVCTTPSAPPAQTPCTDAKQTSLPRLVEESVEESSERNRRAASRTPTLDEWMRYVIGMYPLWTPNGATDAWEHYEQLGWMKGKTPIKNWKFCASTCYRRYASKELPAIQRPASRLKNRPL